MIKLVKSGLCLALITSLAGCSTIERILNPTQDKQDQFNFMSASLLENSSFRSSASFYDLNVTIEESGSGFNYTVTLSNPRKALLNVGIMVMNSMGQQGNQDHIKTVGVMDEVFDLVPNQIYPDQNCVDSLSVSGTISSAPDSLKILVTWNDDDYANYISDFYYVDVQEALSVQF